MQSRRSVILGLVLLTGCAGQQTYPLALPAQSSRVQIPWDNSSEFIPTTPPPPALRYQESPRPAPISLVPSEQEWGTWRRYVPPQTVCRGKGKARRCTQVQPSAVDQANVTAVVKPSAVHTLYGQSILVRYPLELGGLKIYPIETSPNEFTRLLLPAGERRAVNLRLDKEQWEVVYEKMPEDSLHEIISIRPVKAPLQGRDMLMLTSGYPIYLQFVAHEKPGMLSVTWTLPEVPKEPELPPLDQRPPKFHSARAYSGYSIMLEGKAQLTPPWMPKAVVDDGVNTLVMFGASLEGQRMPAVTGLQQNGTPAIVASRLYVHPQKQAESAWVLYVQGLHPALLLKDAAGISVKIVRQVPSQEVNHVAR